MDESKADRTNAEKDKGRILNVSSIAGFLSGPLMAEYYASKNFVLSYTKAIYTELKKEGSEVHISALCPGPTKTNFNKVAKVDFKMKSYTVYKHTSPSGKVYIGITCRKPEYRWNHGNVTHCNM